MEELRPQVVEYQLPVGRAGPTGGEVLLGSLMCAAAIVFALAAVLVVVTLFASDVDRGAVGMSVACAAGVFFGLVATFCGRFSYELFRGRK